jgi:hypothetical protein
VCPTYSSYGNNPETQTGQAFTHILKSPLMAIKTMIRKTLVDLRIRVPLPSPSCFLFPKAHNCRSIGQFQPMQMLINGSISFSFISDMELFKEFRTHRNKFTNASLGKIN